MALSQAVFGILRECKVNNMIRLAVGKTVVYEDKDHVPNDFELAMHKLREMSGGGLTLDQFDELDMILEHDDGTLHYVIDFDIFREHTPGKDPIVIKITAISSELKRRKDEPEENFRMRTEPYFTDQQSFDMFHQLLDSHFENFLTILQNKIKANLGAKEVSLKKETRVLPRGEKDKLDKHTGFGYPFYGFDPIFDLFMMGMFFDYLDSFDLSLDGHNFNYVDPDGTGWDNSGAEGSGEGGWLDSVSDFFGDAFDGGDSGDSSGCGGCGGCGGD